MELFGDVDAVDVREVEVEDDEVVRGLGRAPQRVCASANHVDVREARELAREDARQAGVVLHHQNTAAAHG